MWFYSVDIYQHKWSCSYQTKSIFLELSKEASNSSYTLPAYNTEASQLWTILDQEQC